MGGRPQKQVAGFPSRKAAQAALNEALAGYQHGACVPPSKQTVAEFAEVWLDAIKLEDRGDGLGELPDRHARLCDSAARARPPG